MKKRDQVLEMKDFIQKTMDDTAATLEAMRKDIETKIIDYTFVPGKDIIETDENIIVHVVLPGIKKEDIKLNVTKESVGLTAKFDTTQDIRGTYVTLTDKKEGIIKRNIKLPKKVLPDQATAKFENGILKIKIPKLEKKEMTSVKIE